MSREDDVRVAEIMGWELGKMDSGESEFYSNLSDVCVVPGSRGWQAIPKFTTDPAADYKVLEWVREKYWLGDDDASWDVSDAFEVELNALWTGEKDYHSWEGDPIAYQPGDYSRALLALKDRGLI